MSLEHFEDELVAYLKGEMPEPLRAQVSAHLAECCECRKKLEEYREVLAAAASIRTVEPSPRFNEELKKKLAFARNVRGGSSRRLSTIRTGKHETIIRWRWVALAAAVVMAGLFASSLIFFPRGKPVRIAEDSEKRWNERRLAVRVKRNVVNGRLDVSGILESGPAFLVSHAADDRQADERCVVVYTESEIAALKELQNCCNAQIRENVAAILEKAVPSQVTDGFLTIPEGLIASCLSSARRGEPAKSEADIAVQVLRLEGRTEIWASPVFARYMEVKPIRIEPPRKPG